MSALASATAEALARFYRPLCPVARPTAAIPVSATLSASMFLAGAGTWCQPT